MRGSKKSSAIVSFFAMAGVVVAAGVMAQFQTADHGVVTQTAGKPNLPGKDPSQLAPLPAQSGPEPVQGMPSLVSTDSTHAWFLTADAQLLNSGDAGDTWKTLSTPGGEPTIGVSFATPQLGWLLTAKGLSSTTDGGTSWGPPVQHNGLAFVQRLDATNGWGIAGFNDAVRTTDGGKTWAKVNTPGPVAGACFVSPSEGLIATLSPQAAVFRTSDSGGSWREALRRPSRGLAAALDCNLDGAAVRFDYDHARDETASEETLVTPQKTDDWQVYTSNYDPHTRQRQSAKIGGKADPGARRSAVKLTDGLLVSLHVLSPGNPMIIDFSANRGRSVTRSAAIANVGVPGDRFTFGASFADGQHGLMMINTAGQRALQVLRTSDGGQTVTASVATF